MTAINKKSNMLSDSYNNLDISFIAAKAAAEADFLSKNIDTDIENLKIVTEYMSRGVSSIQGNNGTISALSSPSTVSALLMAYNTSHSVPVESLEELAVRTKELTSELENVEMNKDISSSAFESFRNYCVALANYSMSIRSELLDDTQVDPYRK